MQRSTIYYTLDKIGITNNESRVYTSLLKLGQSLARDIIKSTVMHRTSVYNSLTRLHKKGLVSSIRYEKNTYFKASDPNKLMSLLKERERQLKTVLPHLKKLEEKNTAIEHDVQYYRGKQGIKTIFDDILASATEYIAWGSNKLVEELFKHYFAHFIYERKKKKIRMKVVYFESDRGKDFTKNPHMQVKYLPDEYYSATAHRVYGNKVAIILLQDEPLGILINNKEIADGYRKEFDILWKKAKN